MKVRAFLVLAALVATGLSSLVAHSADPRVCNKASAFPKRVITKIGSGANTIYLDDRQKTADPDPGLVDGGNGTWIFAESNGTAGLQTGGYQVVFDAAQDYEDADTLGWHDREYCTETGAVWTGARSDTIRF